MSDLASAHVLALKYLTDGGESDSFNLGNGEGFSVRAVIETARRITGREIEAIDAPRRPGDPDRLVGNSDKARDILGWRPKHASLQSIIETAWDWHRNAARGT